MDSKIIAISAGGWHSICLDESGKAYSFGWNEFGQLGVGDFITRSLPSLISIAGMFVEKVSCGSKHSLLLTKSGNLYITGKTKYGDFIEHKSKDEKNKLTTNPQLIKENLKSTVFLKSGFWFSCVTE
jgi:alpha-tubulin suppressor-like RCC1 family protein